MITQNATAKDTGDPLRQGSTPRTAPQADMSMPKANDDPFCLRTGRRRTAVGTRSYSVPPAHCLQEPCTLSAVCQHHCPNLTTWEDVTVDMARRHSDGRTKMGVVEGGKKAAFNRERTYRDKHRQPKQCPAKELPPDAVFMVSHRLTCLWSQVLCRYE